MLESGIDRIISQVVDPKINHIFRPQVEKAVHEFLATLNHKEETSPSTGQTEEKPDASLTMQGASATIPSANVANDAMSILETITSLNQEASAARASTEAINSKANDRASKKLPLQHILDSGIERDRNVEDLPDGERTPCNSTEENSETGANSEDTNNLFSSSEEGKTVSKEVNSLVNPSKEVVQESDEPKSKLLDRSDRKSESSEKGERKKEKKEKSEKRVDHLKRSDDNLKTRDEKAAKDREAESLKHTASEKNNSKHKASETTKEALEESDLDVLSDITVSSVHTSDLSSFEEESEEEVALSDSTEEGEIVSDDEEEIKPKPEAGEPNGKKTKSGRHAYVHKPYLYSKYYSDSDDERTVEQRRQSVAREKEERLLRRRLNREKLEEKRKQKAAEKTKSLKIGKKGKSSQSVEIIPGKGLDLKAGGTSTKEVLKEQRIFEKKVALSRKRKRESRHNEEGRKKKCEQSEEDLMEPQKTNESGEKPSSKELKASQGKNEAGKPVRRLSESVHSTDENRSDPRLEREHKRKTSISLQMEGTHQDTEPRDLKFDRTEGNPEESQKQKNALKNEKHIKKDDLDTPSVRSIPKKEGRLSKDKNERERTLFEDKSLTKHKSKGDGIHKISDEAENIPSERGLKGEENTQKHCQLTKALADDKTERKNKHRSERKLSVNNKDMKNVSEHASKNEDGARKENSRKDRQGSTEKSRAEHKSKRLSSDSRPPKESQSALKQHSSATSRRSESYSEDKHDAESTSLENVRQSESIHKDKRRSKSALEERSFLKSKSKSHTKQAKVIETEWQEGSSGKPDSEQKSDKDKNAEESDPDKLSKSKTESKAPDENSLEMEPDSGAHVISSSQKDSSHRVKLQSVEKSTLKLITKTKSDKDLSISRLERKFSSDSHKNRSLKHSGKEMRKREDNKPEDKDSKQIDSHAKMPENELSMDKKSSKRLASESRRAGSLIQEIDMGEEKATATSSVSSPTRTLQKPVRISGHLLHSEQSQEPMELEQRLSSTQHQTSQAEEESNTNSQQETKSKNTVIDQTRHDSVPEQDRSKHSKENSSEPSLSWISNPEQKFGAVPTKEVGIPSDPFKRALKDVKHVEQEPCHVTTKNETRDRLSIPASHKDEKLKFQRMAEDSETPKNLKHIIDSSKESSSPTNNLSREDAVHKKHADMHLAEDTNTSCDVSKGESFVRAGVKDVISDSQTIPSVEMDPRASIVLSNNVKDGEVTDLASRNKSSQVRSICNPATEENISALTCAQETSVLGNVDSASTVQNESAVAFKNMRANTTALTSLEKDEKDCVKESSFAKPSQGATEYRDQIKENNGASVITESSSGSIFIPVPEEISKAARASGGGGRGDVRRAIEDKNGSSVVGSTIEGSKCVDIHNRTESSDAIVIGTSTERSSGSIIAATSSGGGLSNEGTSSHLQREGDAIITCSEEKSGSVLSWTSIEADEGFTVGPWAKGKGGSRFTIEKGFGECSVTAAEVSGSVSEGLAACESSLTSTKAGESGEYSGNDVEQSSKPLIDDSGGELEQRIHSVETEEKDDAVTSAGSEERRLASTFDGTSNFGGAATCTGETDSDGAVTSAGADAQDGPTNANVDGFQTNATGTQQLKAAEGAVTCTGEERGEVGFSICSVTGTDLQEESAVTGACAKMVTQNMAAGPCADKSEDVVNGESAVTSTGITAEDDPEVAAACAGLEDSNEGFAVSLAMQRKYEHSTGSTEARAETNVTEVSHGSCDDEGFVTSTGAKEDDEEGENFVTSTGRGNEETEHPLSCTGAEESGRTLVCEAAAESGSAVCLTAGHLGAEPSALAINMNKGTVDSMTGPREETQHNDTRSSSKGVVESSTTSVGIGGENVMAFIGGKVRESPAAEKSECGLMSATLQQSSGQVSAIKEKSEDAVSYLDSRKREDVCIGTVSKEVATPSAQEEDKGETISTSVVKHTSAHCPDKDIGRTLPLERPIENFEESTSPVAAEDFEAPMPSTAVEYTNQDEAAGVKPNKVSTSLLEEFEAPMPSAAVEDSESLFAAVRAVEMTSTSVEMYTVPTPSAFTGGPDESVTVACNKEERDECTVISTSIIEEPEAPISQVGTGDPVSPFALGPEQTTDAGVISTSTAEHFEAPASPAATQEVSNVSGARTERRFETFSFSTSMSERGPRAACGLTTTVDSQQKDDGTMVSTNATGQCKADLFHEAAGQEFRLAIQSTEETDQSSTAFAGKEGKCETVSFTLASSKPDESLFALSTENPEAKTSARTVEECDSVSAIVVSDRMPHAIVSVGADDERNPAQCAKALDCTIPSAPEGSSDSVELHKESLRSHQEEPEDALKEQSAPSETLAETESTEMPTNTVESVSVGKDHSVETCLGSSVGEGSLPEPCIRVSRAKVSRHHNEAASSLSDILLEQGKGNEDSAIDSINHEPIFETDLSETRDLSDQKSLILLALDSGSGFQDGTLVGATDVPVKCSLPDTEAGEKDHHEPKASSQSSAAHDSDNKDVVPIVTEELKPMTKGTAEEDHQCRYPAKENLDEEHQPGEMLKVLEASDISAIMEEVKDPEEKSLKVIEMPSQEEEDFMPEMTDRHPAVEESKSGDSQVNLTSREKVEESQSLEAKSETDTGANGTDAGKMPEGAANSQESSSAAIEEKGDVVGKVICEKPDLKSSLNPVEVNQQVPVKRKRGRPRKYPVETAAPRGQDSEADTSPGNKTSSPRGRPKLTPKVKNPLKENKKGNETEEGKEEVVVIRRRGRKPKQPRMPSEETGMDAPEPAKKRQKLAAPAVEGEMQDQLESRAEGKNDGDNDGEDDSADRGSGATTRAASRLEAQRKQPSKPTTRATSKNQSPGPVSPVKRRKLAGKKQPPIGAQSKKSLLLTHSKLKPGKRKREASPSVVHKKGHLREDEPEMKKLKR